jgi:hypothetical protein
METRNFEKGTIEVHVAGLWCVDRVQGKITSPDGVDYFTPADCKLQALTGNLIRIGGYYHGSGFTPSGVAAESTRYFVLEGLLLTPEKALDHMVRQGFTPNEAFLYLDGLTYGIRP